MLETVLSHLKAVTSRSIRVHKSLIYLIDSSNGEFVTPVLSVTLIDRIGRIEFLLPVSHLIFILSDNNCDLIKKMSKIS